MNISRIEYLRGEVEEEALSAEELLEIETAFAQIPDSELGDQRENALASDMLDELAARVSPVEKELYRFLYDEYDASEANDPAYPLNRIADRINNLPVKVGGKTVRLEEIL